MTFLFTTHTISRACEPNTGRQCEADNTNPKHMNLFDHLQHRHKSEFEESQKMPSHNIGYIKVKLSLVILILIAIG